MIDDNFDELAKNTSTRRAAGLLGRPRATHYRRLQPPPGPEAASPGAANARTLPKRSQN